MAIVSSIAVGKARGSAGNVTFTTQKGRVIMKEKATIVANPKAPGQVAQRSVLAKAVKAYQLLGSQVKEGLTRRGKFLSEYNRSIQLNIDSMNTIMPNLAAPLSTGLAGFQIADGALVGGSGTIGKTGSIVDIEVNLMGGNLGDVKIGDKFVLVAYSSNNNQVAKTEAVVTANDLINEIVTLTINFASSVTAGIVTGAYFFVSADGTQSSSATMVTV